MENFKKIAKEYNAKIRKEIKVLQGGLTEGKNKNEVLKKVEKSKFEETLEDAIYQSVGLATNEQGIINQALATSNIIELLKKNGIIKNIGG